MAFLVEEDTVRAVRLLKEGCDELGVPWPDERQATLHVSRSTAEQILSGAIPPDRGARRISGYFQELGDHSLVQLHPFVYAASEWDSRPRDHEFFERMIRQAARSLLQP